MCVCVHIKREYSQSRISLSSIFWYNQMCQVGRVNKLFADWLARQFVMQICHLRWKCSTCAEDAIKGPRTRSQKFSHEFFCFFRIRHPFLSKCLLRKRKLRKSNLIWIFLWRAKVLEALCKCYWHNVRSYLFLTSKKFWLSVQWL